MMMMMAPCDLHMVPHLLTNRLPKHEMCSALERSWTIMSHQWISDLKGNVDPMNIIQINELPYVGASRAVYCF